jgi:hypothetical protein
MNQDSLFFFLFMAGAVAYVVIAQRLREWSNRQKKSLGDVAQKQSSDSTTWRPERAEPAERSYTIPEILKRAVERSLVQAGQEEPLPIRRRPDIQRGVSLSSEVVDQPPRREFSLSVRPIDAANVVRIRTALRHPETIRDAIILSEILQAPKALR